MTESNPLKDWELDESDENNSQWQLLDTEQELSPSLQLNPDPSAAVQDWQPVEHADEPQGGRGGWVLPAFIIVAMLAVIGYIVWLGLGGFDLTPETATSPDAPVEDPAVAVVEEPTEEPTVTVPPDPTATTAPEQPSATPTAALVEEQIATIESEYGLNARGAPSTDSEIIILLDDQSSHKVLQEDGEWLQIELDDGSAGWVATQFVSITSELVPAPAGAIAVADEPSAPDEADQTDDGDQTAQAEDVLDSEPEESGDDSLPSLATTGVTPPEPFTDVIPSGPAVIVQTDAGVNARSEPSTDGDVLLTVPQGAALPATAVSDDGEWLEVQLPNDTQGWMFADAVETSGNIDGLAEAGEADDAVGETSTESDPASTDESDPASDETAAETESETTTISTAVIDNLFGLAGRAAPESSAEEIEFLDGGSEWPAVGRTADSTWVQLELANGRTVWVLRGAIQLNVDASELAVIE